MWLYLRSVVLVCVGLLLGSTLASTAVSACRAPPPPPAARPPPPAARLVPRTVAALECPASSCFYDRGFRRIIRQHVSEVRYCYEQALLRRHDLAGHEVLQLTIAADGSVASAAIVNDELREPALAACVVAAAVRWQFLPKAGEELAVVTYPFMLRPAMPASALMADAERRADLRACHEQALWRHLGVAGALVLRITLDEKARVRAATVTATSLSDEKLLACITSIVQRWHFADTERSTTFEKTLWLQPAD